MTAPAKWVVLWNLPEGADVEAWERWYWDEHVPLARAMPGQLRYVTTRVLRTAQGSGSYRMAEQWFPSVAALEAAVASPAGRAVAEHAGDRVVDLVLMVGEEREVEL